MKTTMLLLSAIAALSAPGSASARPPVEFLDSRKVLPPDLPFSEAVRVGDLFFLSGQIGIVPGTMTLAPGGMAQETRQAMDNIKATLAANGLTTRDLVKCTVMLADMSQWSAFNDAYRTYFTDRYPARSAIGVNGLALGAQVEIDCIAAAVAGD